MIGPHCTPAWATEREICLLKKKKTKEYRAWCVQEVSKLNPVLNLYYGHQYQFTMQQEQSSI